MPREVLRGSLDDGVGELYELLPRGGAQWRILNRLDRLSNIPIDDRLNPFDSTRIVNGLLEHGDLLGVQFTVTEQFVEDSPRTRRHLRASESDKNCSFAFAQIVTCGLTCN